MQTEESHFDTKGNKQLLLVQAMQSKRALGVLRRQRILTCHRQVAEVVGKKDAPLRLRTSTNGATMQLTRMTSCRAPPSTTKQPHTTMRTTNNRHYHSTDIPTQLTLPHHNSTTTQCMIAVPVISAKRAVLELDRVLQRLAPRSL